jgi:predicted membrane channel-forming protein YqfA (hemolysin III family)
MKEKEPLSAKIDAYIFRVLALVIGFGAAAGIIVNNDPSDLVTTPFALFFVLVFLAMGFTSLYSIGKGIFGYGDKE